MTPSETIESFRHVTCPDCSARYRIPGHLTSGSATCKKCGGTISLATTEAPAAATPSAGTGPAPAVAPAAAPAVAPATPAATGPASPVAPATPAPVAASAAPAATAAPSGRRRATTRGSSSKAKARQSQPEPAAEEAPSTPMTEEQLARRGSGTRRARAMGAKQATTKATPVQLISGFAVLAAIVFGLIFAMV